MKGVGNSQQTESLLLSDGALVGYAVEEGVEDIQNEQQEFHGVARRGRRRAFAIRHHQVDTGGPRELVGQGGDVRLELEQVMQQVGGLEGQGVALSDGDVYNPSHHVGSTLMAGEGIVQQEHPLKMGTGAHALTVDANLMSMVLSSKKHDLSMKPITKPKPKKRRQQAKSTPVGRRKSSGLGDRILSTQIDPPNGGTASPMQDFMSTVPAPSQIVQSRARMRAPATLTQLADSLDDRLCVLASTRSGNTVSTLKLHLRTVHMAQGKMMCRCLCENPMGVLSGHDVIVVMRCISEMAALVSDSSSLGETTRTTDGHEIIVSKPWLILDGGTRPEILLCLGDVAHRYVPC